MIVNEMRLDDFPALGVTSEKVRPSYLHVTFRLHMLHEYT
jgi:hypothetical protein